MHSNPGEIRKKNNAKLKNMLDYAGSKKMSNKEVEKLLLLANTFSIEEARKMVQTLVKKEKEKAGLQLDEFFASIRAESAEQKRKIAEIIEESKKNESTPAQNADKLETLKLALEWRQEGNTLSATAQLKLEYLHTTERFLQNKKELILELKNLHQELIDLNQAFDKGAITTQDLDQKLPNLSARLTKVSNDTELTAALASHSKVQDSPEVLKEIRANATHNAQYEKMNEVYVAHEGLELQFMQLAEKLHKQRQVAPSNSATKSSPGLAIPARSLSMEKEHKPEKDFDISPAAA